MNPKTKDTLEAMQAIIESAREATEKERQRCLDIVASAEGLTDTEHSRRVLVMVAHKIKEGI